MTYLNDLTYQIYSNTSISRTASNSWTAFLSDESSSSQDKFLCLKSICFPEELLANSVSIVRVLLWIEQSYWCLMRSSFNIPRYQLLHSHIKYRIRFLSAHNLHHNQLCRLCFLPPTSQDPHYMNLEYGDWFLCWISQFQLDMLSDAYVNFVISLVISKQHCSVLKC